LISKKEELPDQWKESISVPVHKKGDKTDCNNYRRILLLTSYIVLTKISFLHGYVHTHLKLLRAISVDLDLKDQIPIKISAFLRYWRKNGSRVRQHIGYQ
jgi:hypothetical protein